MSSSPVNLVLLRFSQKIQYIKTRAHKNGRLEQERVTPIEAHCLGKIIELLLKIEYLVTCRSKAAGTSTSKLGYHLQTESLTSLSAQNLFADRQMR